VINGVDQPPDLILAQVDLHVFYCVLHVVSFANLHTPAARTRPLCPFPQIAVCKGSGSVDDARPSLLFTIGAQGGGLASNGLFFGLQQSLQCSHARLCYLRVLLR
jgi:hypothetical protein